MLHWLYCQNSSLIQPRMACVPRCSICYDLIREPVVFPCGHEICRECFDDSLKTANFYCPLCRKRVSSWARRYAKDPVDRRRKKELEQKMRELQEQRTTSIDDAELRWKPSICQPGEIRREYLQEVEKVKKERVEEEMKGEGEAWKLQQDEEEKAKKWCLDRQSEELLGEEAASQLLEKEKRNKEVWQLQQQQDEYLAHVLSQGFIQQQLESERKQTLKDRHLAEKLNQVYNGMEQPSREQTGNLPSKSCGKQAKVIKMKPRQLSHPAGLKPITTWFKQTTSTSKSQSGGGQ